MDKTNVTLYSSTLERLYKLQNMYTSSNVTQIQDLLNQKIQLLESVINL